MTEQQQTLARPGLAVRQPRRIEGPAVEADRDAGHLETVLASLRPDA